MHLAPATTDTYATLTEDTFSEHEYAALCEVVAATHIGGPLVHTVQTAVTNAYMTRSERWVSEAKKYMDKHQLTPEYQPVMHRA
jgi:hypothetical protein